MIHKGTVTFLESNQYRIPEFQVEKQRKQLYISLENRIVKLF